MTTFNMAFLTDKKTIMAKLIAAAGDLIDYDDDSKPLFENFCHAIIEHINEHLPEVQMTASAEPDAKKKKKRKSPSEPKKPNAYALMVKRVGAIIKGDGDKIPQDIEISLTVNAPDKDVELLAANPNIKKLLGSSVQVNEFCNDMIKVVSGDEKPDVMKITPIIWRLVDDKSKAMLKLETTESPEPDASSHEERIETWFKTLEETRSFMEDNKGKKPLAKSTIGMWVKSQTQDYVDSTNTMSDEKVRKEWEKLIEDFPKLCTTKSKKN